MINEKPFVGMAYPDAKTDCRCAFCRAGLVMDFPAQLISWARTLAGETGSEVVLFVADKAWLKTRQQEKGFHAMIAPWAKERGYSVPELKQYLLGEIFGWTESAIDGKPILVEPRTSGLPKAKYSQLIEETLRIAAEKDDVYLEAPSEYRERKAQERKKAARKVAA